MADNIGSGSASLRLDASGGGDYGEATIEIGASGVGYVGNFGTGNVSLSLGASSIGEIGVIGSGKASMSLGGSRAVGLVTIAGQGSAEIKLSSARDLTPGPLGGASPNLPSGYVVIYGSGSASLRLSAKIVAQLAEVYKAFLMNTKSKGHARYSDYPYNSLFTINGISYGCAANGIHRLDGKDDNGTDIDTSIKTGVLTFGAIEQKNISDVYLQLRAFGDMALDVTCVEESKRTGYVIQDDGVKGLHGRRKKLAKGIEGTSWQVEIKNVAGADFDLRQIDMDVDTLEFSV